MSSYKTRVAAMLIIMCIAVLLCSEMSHALTVSDFYAITADKAELDRDSDTEADFTLPSKFPFFTSEYNSLTVSFMRYNRIFLHYSGTCL